VRALAQLAVKGFLRQSRRRSHWYLHVIMETKGGKKSKKSSIQYESPLGYVIEDVRPHGGSEKFRTAAYSNCVRKPS
jgi:hypothetical protein